MHSLHARMRITPLLCVAANTTRGFTIKTRITPLTHHVLILSIAVRVRACVCSPSPPRWCKYKLCTCRHARTKHSRSTLYVCVLHGVKVRWTFGSFFARFCAGHRISCAHTHSPLCKWPSWSIPRRFPFCRCRCRWLDPLAPLRQQ